MTDPSTPTPVGTLLRISVSSADRRIDLGAPGNVAVVEIVPGLARALGVLDAGSVYGGYHLVTAAGVPLDPARSLLASGVEDGEVLTLEVGAARPEPRVYDDVVEAVADAVETRFRPWTPHDSALGAAWGAAALLAATGLLLLGAASDEPLPPVVAAVGALLAVVAGAVVARVGRDAGAARVLVLSGGLLGAVAGLTLGEAAPSWGWPAAAPVRGSRWPRCSPPWPCRTRVRSRWARGRWVSRSASWGRRSSSRRPNPRTCSRCSSPWC